MKIAILGYGTVGKGVETLAIKNGIEVTHILMRDIDELTKTNMTKCLADIYNDSSLDCVIECIGGDEPAHSYVVECLNHHLNVISSNKKMLVKHLKELEELVNKNELKLLFSSACGGAIPWLAELNKISKSDNLEYFKGIMNGTSNYILNKMFNENLSFDVALQGAQKLGYAEQDPSDDIDGVDTANKTVLSMALGYRREVKLDDVFVKGIRYINDADLAYVKKHNYKCALLGQGNENTCYVMPCFINNKSVFYNIVDNYNCFMLKASGFGPFHLIGQGAGSLPTASNVIRDLFDLNNSYKLKLESSIIPNYDEKNHIFYLRTCHKISSNFVEEMIEDNTYITKKISINELKTLIEDQDFVGEIIND